MTSNRGSLTSLVSHCDSPFYHHHHQRPPPHQYDYHLERRCLRCAQCRHISACHVTNRSRKRRTRRQVAQGERPSSHRRGKRRHHEQRMAVDWQVRHCMSRLSMLLSTPLSFFRSACPARSPHHAINIFPNTSKNTRLSRTEASRTSTSLQLMINLL